MIEARGVRELRGSVSLHIKSVGISDAQLPQQRGSVGMGEGGHEDVEESEVPSTGTSA